MATTVQRARAPRFAPPHRPWRRYTTRVSDVLAAGLILLVAAYAVAPLFTATDLVTGAGDWHAHAYRIRELGRHGLATWTHDWAGGLPPWSAYQFVPHTVTLAAMRVTGADETRAMAAAQGVLLAAVPLVMFASLRAVRIGTWAALLGALLTLTLDTRRQPAANFSELWGLALAPALLCAAYRTHGRRGGHLIAAAVGLAGYVHPLAAVVGVVGMAAAALTHGRWSSVVAGARRPRVLVVQGVIAAGAAAFSLWPAFDAARPAYEHPYFASAGFERLLARLALESFAPGWPVWTGLSVAAVAVLARRGGGERRAMARCLLMAAALLTGAILGALAGWGPRVFHAMQLPRLVSVLPLLCAAGAALLIDEALDRARSRVRTGRGAGAARWAPPLLGVTVALAACAAAVRDSTAGLHPRDGEALVSPFGRWLASRPSSEVPEVGARISAPPEIVAGASFEADGQGWYTGSYSGREWSILAGPLQMFMEGLGAPETRAAYLTAMAVELAVVPSGQRPVLIDPRTGWPVEWEIAAHLDGIDVLRLPWRAPYAFAVPRGAEQGLSVPDRRFASVADAYVRDELTRRYAALALGPRARPAAAWAPSGTTIDIDLRESPPDHVLLISENWDTSWRAEAGNHRLPVYRAGPNLIAVDLTGAPRGPEGDVHVHMTHGVPRAWWLGGAVTLLALTAAVLAWWRGPRMDAPARVLG